jgi:magnesium-transporting ATPase (P-type)
MVKNKYNRFVRIDEQTHKELQREKMKYKKMFKEDITYSKILKKKMMNKNGSLVDLAIFLMFTMLVIVFFAVWSYGFGLVNTALLSIEATDTQNISGATLETFNQVNTAQQTWLPILSYALIFGMILSIFISNFLVRANPIFFLGYILATVVMFSASVIISNVYQGFLTDPGLSAIFSSWTIGNFIMLYLPYIVAGVGFLGAMFLFLGVQADEGLGGGL